MKNYLRIGAIVGLALLTQACGGIGKQANLVERTSVMDNYLSCELATAEVAALDVRLSGAKQRDRDQETKNIVWGVAGALLFAPALLAMDFSDATEQEIASIEARQVTAKTIQAQRCFERAQGIAGPVAYAPVMPSTFQPAYPPVDNRRPAAQPTSTAEQFDTGRSGHGGTFRASADAPRIRLQ